LAATPELKICITEQIGSKSNFGETIMMHAKEMLNNNELIFRNNEQNISPLIADKHERLINTC
jgi:hypothetical protein